jgi:hypothetical protein
LHAASRNFARPFCVLGSHMTGGLPNGGDR